VGANIVFSYSSHCLKYVCEHGIPFQIKNPAQLDAALSFLSNIGPDSLDIKKFEEACGVGMFPLNDCFCEYNIHYT
jgi:hypothetical protein